MLPILGYHTVFSLYRHFFILRVQPNTECIHENHVKNNAGVTLFNHLKKYLFFKLPLSAKLHEEYSVLKQL